MRRNRLHSHKKRQRGGYLNGEQIPYPNPTDIPSPAYLIMGVAPGEHKEYINDPSFYTLSIEDVYLGRPAEQTGRHIHVNFNEIDSINNIGTLYANKFDLIMFDIAVTDKIEEYTFTNLILNLFKMLKSNGKIVIDEDFSIPNDILKELEPEYYEDKERCLKESVMDLRYKCFKDFREKYMNLHSTFHERILEYIFKNNATIDTYMYYTIKKLDEINPIMNDHSIIKHVYEEREKLHPTLKLDDKIVFLITKTAQNGGKRKLTRKKVIKKKRMTRRK